MTLLDTAVSGICPHPEKHGRFRTLEYAEAAARARSIIAGKPIYTYACECGLYHLTRSKPGKSKRRHHERPVMNHFNGTLAPGSESALVWSSEPQAETIEELLDRARYGSTRAQSLAQDIDRLVVDLTAVLDQDAARLEKESRAAELRAEIALRTAELEAIEADLFDGEPEPLEEPDAEAHEPEGESPDEAVCIAPGGASADVEEPAGAAASLTREQIDSLVPHFMYDGRVRGWARRSGYEVSARGRIAANVVRMWVAAHPDEAQA